MRLLNQNLIKITELLSDGKYHDATSIGHHLNITRASVWKVMKKLKQYSIPLTSVKGKGYYLASPLILIDPEKIRNKLNCRSVELDVFEKVDSTNDYLKKFISEGKKIRVCMAETQVQGKGQMHRRWYSPFGKNIYLSILYPFKKDISELSGLSLVVALAVCRAVESTVMLKSNRLKVKWPNDVLIDKKKLSGILTEMKSTSKVFCQVIVGVGINVNMDEAPGKKITQAWTSLFKLTKAHQDRNDLSVKLIDTLIDYFERFSSKGLSAFKKEWQKRDCLAGMNIAVKSGHKKLAGTCVGVNAQGQLLIKTKENTTLTFSSGDATLLK